MKIVLFTLLIITLFIAGTSLQISNPATSKGSRGDQTKLNMNIMRVQIREFYNNSGTYPTVKSWSSDWGTGRDSSEKLKVLSEYISTSGGSRKISNNPDGSGGWYYDETTGGLKVNLTKPLKTYYPAIWFSSRKNEIPSHW